MSIEQIEISTTEYLVTLQDGSNLQTLEITEGVQLDVLLSEMGLQGPAGPAGKSISSVVKTSTVGLVDTYTITFNDSTTQTFTVTNGTDGVDGVNGRGIVSITRTSGTGAAGTTDTYTITYTDSTTSTFTVYNGADGAGSVSSVGLSVPTGLTVSNSPITTSGTLAVTYTAGYSIPTTAKQSDWDTAYGWGNHATSGYATITGVETLTNKTLTSAVITGAVLNDGYTEEVFAVTGTAPALSPANGSIQTWVLSGNSTPTAGTWASGQSMTLMVDDGSAYTINWASMSITWKTGGGTAPTLLTTGYTVIELVKVGSTIYGWLAGDA
jgi:hypothetical protein